ncbi:4-alpha-glucanotransferase [Achromobacter kerstersii]
MSPLSALAAEAGIAEDWTGADQRPRRVSPDTLRALLSAMDLPAASDADIRDSRQRLAATLSRTHLPAMLIALPGELVSLPPDCAGAYQLQAAASAAIAGRTAHGPGLKPTLRAPATPGYYALSTQGGECTLAVAPPRAPSLDDICRTKHPRAWGLTAQVYSLRRPSADVTQSTHGFGDFGALRELAMAAGQAGADALAISPVHAMFAADPAQCSPYSPSSRLFVNTLFADPAGVLGEEAVRAALAGMDLAQLRMLDAQPLINWPAAARLRHELLRRLHAGFATDATTGQRQAYEAFCNAAGPDLHDHALFEALHGNHAQGLDAPLAWTHWPADLRDPRSSAAQRYATDHAEAVDVHRFSQWLASASLSRAQQAARDAGMRVGLVADLAVGGSPQGSHAWSRQADLMKCTSVGAPPDLYNPLGQGWGLTALSPAALHESGYAAFLAMLRANLAHAGGLRIDHILGLARLWLIPDGASPEDGGYLRYPMPQLLRLIALEAWLHHALIIGENLGTVPEGFDAQLEAHGVLGMDVLWFMRAADGAKAAEPAKAADGDDGNEWADGPDTADGNDATCGDQGTQRAYGAVGADGANGANGAERPHLTAEEPAASPPAAFLAPGDWPANAVAMTTTHDLPTLEGWWHAQDILWRSRLSLLGPDQEEAALRAARLEDRATLWRSVQSSSPAASTLPLPRRAPSAELLGFVAATPCPLMLVPLEDLAGQLDQPNLPGTVAHHPNWRQRTPLSVAECLNSPASQARLQPVRAVRGRT